MKNARGNLRHKCRRTMLRRSMCRARKILHFEAPFYAETAKFGHFGPETTSENAFPYDVLAPLGHFGAFFFFFLADFFFFFAEMCPWSGLVGT